MKRDLIHKKFSGKIIISNNCIDLVYENTYQYSAENDKDKYLTKEYVMPPNEIIWEKDMTLHQRQLMAIAHLCIEQLTKDFEPDLK